MYAVIQMKALIEKKPVFLNVSLMRLYPVNIVGQDPAEILLQSPKQYGYLKTFSALMHIIIHIKIQMFKRKDTPRRKNLIETMNETTKTMGWKIFAKQ